MSGRGCSRARQSSPQCGCAMRERGVDRPAGGGEDGAPSPGAVGAGCCARAGVVQHRLDFRCGRCAGARMRSTAAGPRPRPARGHGLGSEHWTSRRSARVPARAAATRARRSAPHAAVSRHARRRGRGEGIEFADVRAFQVGDRVRQVNWRVTARRGSLQVNDRHPEHSSDVVLLIDTFQEARDGASGTLDSAVRAAAALARAHLARRDRVGVVDFGGMLHWLEPAFGTTQLYRIVDALLASEIAFSYAWRNVEGIPPRVIPSGALILAISPLLDERSIAVVTDLRRRGHDVTVVEVSPLDYVSPGASAADIVAYRFWRLEREALRARLQGLGIGVAVWEQDASLGPVLEGVNEFDAPPGTHCSGSAGTRCAGATDGIVRSRGARRGVGKRAGVAGRGCGGGAARGRHGRRRARARAPGGGAAGRDLCIAPRTLGCSWRLCTAPGCCSSRTWRCRLLTCARSAGSRPRRSALEPRPPCWWRRSEHVALPRRRPPLRWRRDDRSASPRLRRL